MYEIQLNILSNAVVDIASSCSDIRTRLSDAMYQIKKIDSSSLPEKLAETFNKIISTVGEDNHKYMIEMDLMETECSLIISEIFYLYSDLRSYEEGLK